MALGFQRIIKNPPSQIPFFRKRCEKPIVFGPTKIIIYFWCPPRAFQNIDPQITKIPTFQNVILCSVIDIGTIFAKSHSCF